MWLEFSFNDFREDKALLTRVLRDFPPIEQAYKSQQHANAKANSHMSFISHIVFPFPLSFFSSSSFVLLFLFLAPLLFW
jgi:hypothetical protein